MRIAAFHNACYVALCNRVGEEGDVTFAGNSLVAGPRGEIVAQAGGGEELLLADLDLRAQEEACRNHAYLPLLRPEAFDYLRSRKG